MHYHTAELFDCKTSARELCTSYVEALFIIYFIRTQYLKYIIYIQIRCTPDAVDINTLDISAT